MYKVVGKLMRIKKRNKQKNIEQQNILRGRNHKPPLTRHSTNERKLKEQERDVNREQKVQPKSSRYTPLMENKLLKEEKEAERGGGKERGQKVRKKVIFMRSFLYRCVKEDATEITLMMLFFYLLGHMPPMSFKL